MGIFFNWKWQIEIEINSVTLIDKFAFFLSLMGVEAH